MTTFTLHNGQTLPAILFGLTDHFVVIPIRVVEITYTPATEQDPGFSTVKTEPVNPSDEPTHALYWKKLHIHDLDNLGGFTFATKAKAEDRAIKLLTSKIQRHTVELNGLQQLLKHYDDSRAMESKPASSELTPAVENEFNPLTGRTRLTVARLRDFLAGFGGDKVVHLALSSRYPLTHINMEDGILKAMTFRGHEPIRVSDLQGRLSTFPDDTTLVMGSYFEPVLFAGDCKGDAFLSPVYPAGLCRETGGFVFPSDHGVLGGEATGYSVNLGKDIQGKAILPLEPEKAPSGTFDTLKPALGAFYLCTETNFVKSSESDKGA